MEYCPYCAGSVPASAKVCPACKKPIDLEKIQALYQEDTVTIDKQVARKLWFQSNYQLFISMMFLIIGLIGGGMIMYGYIILHSASEKSDFERQIQDYQNKLNEQAASVSKDTEVLREKMKQKDQIITVLANQRQLLSQILSFTRRLAENSVITPNSTEETDYYQRNTRYIIGQYVLESEKLKQLNMEDPGNYNLETVPQLLAQ